MRRRPGMTFVAGFVILSTAFVFVSTLRLGRARPSACETSRG
ncbi:hypothetical protein DB32_007694 [Sandaracinus amylolyticus]|uniref:Uncharacterized protein n=1 Tax=Sandaracinus amylolyticus TaxID=927083 RepID=A0A0F6YMA8_9BACT|nr:hypothetical protein DB32_007694 [Sandaracinus amylolyticus]